MAINIYQDFYSDEEIMFMTGRVQKSRIIEQLNKQGIPFSTKANGFPLVRRDYTGIKPKKRNSSQPKEPVKTEWKSAVLTEG